MRADVVPSASYPLATNGEKCSCTINHSLP